MSKSSGSAGRGGGAAAMERNLRAAAEGQPSIVREALYSGVSTLRVSLTDKERRQLAKARRAGILSYQPARGDFGRTLGPSPKTLFGG